MPSKFNKVKVSSSAIHESNLNIEDHSPSSPEVFPSESTQDRSVRDRPVQHSKSAATPRGASNSGHPCRSAKSGLPTLPPSTAASSKDSQWQFWRAHDVLQEIFAAHNNFWMELGSNPFKFVDIGSAPGGFARYLLDHSQCIGGSALSLPVECGGQAMSISDSRLQVIMQDLFQASPQKCFGKLLVDLCVADVSYFRKLSSCGTAHKDEQVNAAQQEIKGFGGLRSRNPFLGNWAVLLHELWLGLSVLGQGGVMIFRFPGTQACTYDWHIDACICFLTFVDSLFMSTEPFKPHEKVCYIVCRGYNREDSLASESAQALHQSSLEILQHGAVQGVLNVKLFNKMRQKPQWACKASWIRDIYLKYSKSGKTAGKAISSQELFQGSVENPDDPLIRNPDELQEDFPIKDPHDIPSSAQQGFSEMEKQLLKQLPGVQQMRRRLQAGGRGIAPQEEVPTSSTSCDSSFDDLASQDSESSPCAPSLSASARLDTMPLPLQLLGRKK